MSTKVPQDEVKVITDFGTDTGTVEGETPLRHGFLPMNTNLFDRVFISVVILVAIHLLWLRFVEALLPLWIATVISVILAVFIIRRG